MQNCLSTSHREAGSQRGWQVENEVTTRHFDETIGNVKHLVAFCCEQTVEFMRMKRFFGFGFFCFQVALETFSFSQLQISTSSNF